MKNLCIIPARGGSKRIPQKNIKPFLGRPIIQYSIEAALESNLFDTVMVSTDDEQIAAVAKSAGATVPFMRSAENANDFAGTADVLIEVLQQYKTQNTAPVTACCLYAAAPFATKDLLIRTYLKFTQSDCDTLFPVLRFDYPVQRGLFMRNGEITMREPEHRNTRSQDLEPVYHDAGMFYFFRTAPLLKTGQLWGGRTNGYLVNSMQAQDIDTVMDWEAAEWKYRYAKEKGMI